MTMGDLKTRLRAKFNRRSSTTPSVSSNDGELTQADAIAKPVAVNTEETADPARSAQQAAIMTTSLAGAQLRMEVNSESMPGASQETSATELGQLQPGDDHQQLRVRTSSNVNSDSTQDFDSTTYTPAHATPNIEIDDIAELNEPRKQSGNGGILEVNPGSSTTSAGQRPSEGPKQQSLLSNQDTRLLHSLLEDASLPPSRAGGNFESSTSIGRLSIRTKMGTRKIWVKRPGSSATLVTIQEDDLVDDVRDMILRKYANSLGRSFDAPDVTLRICPRELRQERTLGPDEHMWRTIDDNFPGGQTLEEALIIEVPLKRTPRPSPRGGPQMAYYHEELRPGEAGSEYFPPMPVYMNPAHVSNGVPVAVNGGHQAQSQHAMSVINTGHVPSLPSPGGSRRLYSRPRVGRTATSSPTVLSGHVPTPASLSNGTLSHTRGTRSRTHSSASEKSNAPPAPPLLPTPPAVEAVIQRAVTPPPRVSSPRVSINRVKKIKKSNGHPTLPIGLLSGAVPPINVLIVEDNIINLKLLEAFMKRLRVRWQSAMNGKEAVTKWRTGGFHLVLMDIQLPVMNGLEATREIRRLEKLNSIGVFSSSASSIAPQKAPEPEGDDKLASTLLFKSPVIIVALTASSLQTDRHEALAAGCNDFLTKVCPILHHLSNIKSHEYI
jgi:osomolarity two-component system response regulator SSK1